MLQSSSCKDLDFLDESSIYYVAGYVLRRLNVHENFCSSCLEFLLSSREEAAIIMPYESQWTQALDIGGLKYPTHEFYQLIMQLEKVFRNYMEQAERNHPVISFMEIFDREIYPNWSYFVSRTNCSCSWQSLISEIAKFYFKSRMHFRANRFSVVLKMTKKSQQQKSKEKIHQIS